MGGVTIEEREVWSVTDLVSYLRSALEAQQLRQVWIKGEISNFVRNERSGHMYFTLKDESAKIRAAMFARRNRRLSFLPKDGDEVFVRGHVSVYERDGQMQLYVLEMQMSGLGNLYLAFQQLKEQLEKKGYFSAPKKELPAFPNRVGVITSPSGAVIRDIITTIRRRFPSVQILLYPVSVQGENAASEIAHAIDRMNQLQEVDVLIIGRGGGSMEELWAFNEEIVAESIYRSRIPIVSAVGHETDVTISDYTADLRAPTPTAAAELVVPDRRELQEYLASIRQRLIQSIVSQIQLKQNQLRYVTERPVFKQPQHLYAQYIQRLDTMATTLRHHFFLQIQKKTKQLNQLQYQLQQVDPSHQVAQQRQAVKHLSSLLEKQMKQRLKEARRTLMHMTDRLDALSPLKVMRRGYSLVYPWNQQKMITRAKQANVGDLIRVRFSDGVLKCQVWSVEEWKDEK